MFVCVCMAIKQMVAKSMGHMVSFILTRSCLREFWATVRKYHSPRLFCLNAESSFFFINNAESSLLLTFEVDQQTANNISHTSLSEGGVMS